MGSWHLEENLCNCAYPPVHMLPVILDLDYIGVQVLIIQIFVPPTVLLCFFFESLFVENLF